MDLETIRVQSDGGIATITLSRPAQGNSISVKMVRELEQTCYELEDKSDDQVLVIRGAGGVFCQGIDLLDFPAEGKPDVRGFSRWEKACRTIERLSMVTLAAIDGECAGGGLQLALTCDVRVATQRSLFYLNEVRDGFLPGMGTFRLAKFIGLGRARFMALTGRRLEPQEAWRIGLVDHVCEQGGLDSAVQEVIEQLRPIHPDAIELTRRLFDESFEIPYEEFVGCFLAAQHRAIQTEAFRQRVREAHRLGVPRPREPGKQA